MTVPFPCLRPPPERRCFRSAVVDALIDETVARIDDPELAWLFSNCFPNTLDTTVDFGRDREGRPDTFIITGDIDAMWLRDSTNQVWPYLPLMERDPALCDMVEGLVRRQAACILLDPYANAFYKDGTRVSKWESDITEMRPGVHERKYELDSLCAFLRLSAGLYRHCPDTGVFDDKWREALQLVVDTIRHEQAGHVEGPPAYTFQRRDKNPTETLQDGVGFPLRRCGMSRSPFRPSDDATIFGYLVPANAMAVVTLRAVADIPAAAFLAGDMNALADEIDRAIHAHGIVAHPEYGRVFAYEVDGRGSVLFMDDANVPSLLSLPYLGYVDAGDPVYQNTRRLVLGEGNPFFARGTAARGIGGPHVGPGWIWPMSLILQGLTSRDLREIDEILQTLKRTHAGTGFMHESFWKDDPTRFTRPWFAWVNTLFGELVLEWVQGPDGD
ncbi:MAG: glycoside hydrolase family 125 protein [Verrucomicrobia bacterium]|nr:glycoside hydrolase family 125 protein [Verrucomicrobiota bacterium]MCH8513143.1 glycoside hydrolase family 125 protein [Kiritimatiellia bacterium]